MRQFFNAVECGYCKDVPYHNQAHAASVVHFMHALLFHGGIADAVQGFFDRDVVVIGCLVAAAIHDYDHLGLNNKFLETTEHERSHKFTSSVNENHHFEAAMELLMCPENNFLPFLGETKSNEVQELVKALVLATDAAEDSTFRKGFEGSCFESGKFRLNSKADALLALQIALKCADLGHLATDWEEHVEWVARLEQEFFCQGDLEREHGFEEISFLMDRNVGGVSDSQTGFFEYVAVPLFQVLTAAFPRAQPMLDMVNSNFNEWKRIENKRKLLDRRHTMA
jgi:cAMP-specific phosphodiesterase 4/calcium/calmodulin-dependent 3',5'-cyclic nucleotide phosphodiesterase